MRFGFRGLSSFLLVADAALEEASKLSEAMSALHPHREPGMHTQFLDSLIS